MKKVKILTTWWTLFQEEENNVRQVKDNSESMIQKTKQILKTYANIDDIESVYNIDSSDLTPEKRELLANNILRMEAQDPTKYSGYLITHGTDTMAYTSSMLSFLLKGLKKPVVLTGSMIGLGEADSDGPNNLVNAIQVSTNPELMGVLICFWDKVIQGNKAKKEDTGAFDTFDSPKYDLIGRFTHAEWSATKKLILNKEQVSKSNAIVEKQQTELFENLHAKVMPLKLVPWMDLSIFDYLVQSKVEGLVLEGYGDGNVPTSKEFQDKIAMCIAAGMVIVLKSQCHTGPAEHKYEGAQAVLNLGVISGMNMTSEAAYTKIMWLLTNKSRYNTKEMFATNVSWELL